MAGARECDTFSTVPGQLDFFGSHDPVGAITKTTQPWTTVGSASLFHGDSLEILEQLPPSSIDVIFADPPYFLSNGGTTCQAGKRVSVDKGKWDASKGLAEDHEFNRRWLDLCQRALTPNGTIWVSGTMHVIFSVGFAMQELGFKLLNDIAWEKPNPPPNIGCRCFTHSKETVLWAARGEDSEYWFDYRAMKRANGDKQVKDVWRIAAPGRAERKHGKHPTQKPVALLDRILAASARPGSWVLDPFNGSGTTGVVAVDRGLRYIGVEKESKYLALTERRIAGPLGQEIDQDAARDRCEDHEHEQTTGCLF